MSNGGSRAESWRRQRIDYGIYDAEQRDSRMANQLAAIEKRTAELERRVAVLEKTATEPSSKVETGVEKS